MTITSADIAKLRKMTGAGMMDCKEALNESKGDFEAAIDYLRKKGQKISAKRADREANEGIVVARTNDSNTKGVIIEINCETDFVAKNEEFSNFVSQVANKALELNPSGIDELIQIKLDNLTIAEKLDELRGKIGEKIELSSYKKLEGKNVVSYNHYGNKIGVLVALNIPGTQFHSPGKDVAMQVAALNPVAVNKERVPEEVVTRETEIAMEQTRQEGKPENLLEKISQGKLNKFFKENTLLSQDFVKDNTKTIDQFLKGVDKNLTVDDFIRVGIAS